jgi:pyridoxal phosphate enzyme (YggS family)
MGAVNLINLNKVLLAIKEAEQPASLMVVSKNRSIKDVKEFIDLGLTNFGENRVQEAKLKFYDSNAIDLNSIYLSLIGPLQSNKVSLALKIFNSIQTIDRKKIIDEISIELQTNKLIKTKEFFIQINIGLETQKSGVEPNQVGLLYDYAIKKNINIKGIMCIPPLHQDASIYFKQMKKIQKEINPDWLISMGMSGDYQPALEHGSNIIRIGQLLYNE